MTERTGTLITVVGLCIGSVLIGGLIGAVGWWLNPGPVVYRDTPAPSIQVPIDGKMVTVPDGYEIVIESDDKEEILAVVADIKKAGDAVGPAAYESGSDIKATWKAEGLNLDIDGVGMSGGGVDAKWQALGGANGVTILAAIGGLALIAGFVLVVRGPRKIGVGLILGGLATLAAVFFPWLLLVVAALAIGGVVYVIWRTAKTKNMEKELAEQDVTLQTIVRGVENTVGDAADKVKEKIEDAAKAIGAKDVVDKQVDKRK